MYKKILTAAIGLSAMATAQAAPSLEEMWSLIQKQQSEITQLKTQLETTEQRVAETEVKTEATFAAVEEVTAGPVAKLAEWADKTTIGGYGELHYNNLTSDNSDGSKDEFDLHRFVIFFGHQFNDDLRFFSELEVEHNIAGEGKNGEVEVEQAYVEWDYTDNHSAKAGVFLIPVGLINETHEPETFYGVERNPVEKNIIPATWWEGGLMFNGEIAEGFSYDAGVHSGLFINPDPDSNPLTSDGKSKIRDGRQKVSKAKGDDLAYTARIKYTGMPGLELAATVQHQTDVWQGESFAGEEEADATMLEFHAAYNNGPFGVRALYAHWDIDDAIESVKAGADEQEGFYIEPSYRITEKLGVFARFSEWDNQAGSNNDSEKQQYDIGFNYWLHERVVLKADYRYDDNEGGSDEFRGFNLGVGWSF